MPMDLVGWSKGKPKNKPTHADAMLGLQIALLIRDLDSEAPWISTKETAGRSLCVGSTPMGGRCFHETRGDLRASLRLLQDLLGAAAHSDGGGLGQGERETPDE